MADYFFLDLVFLSTASPCSNVTKSLVIASTTFSTFGRPLLISIPAAIFSARAAKIAWRLLPATLGLPFLNVPASFAAARAAKVAWRFEFGFAGRPNCFATTASAGADDAIDFSFSRIQVGYYAPLYNLFIYTLTVL